MGNGVINCCEASSSMKDEMTVLSPRTMISPTNKAILNEVSQIRYQSTPEYRETLTRSSVLKTLSVSSGYILKVINSGPLSKDTRFIISFLGLQGTKRTPNDGRVFFGSKRKEYGKVANDIVIPSQKNHKDYCRGKHFVITYNLQLDKFYIKDLGKGFGVYLRLSSPVFVRNGMVLNIGSVFLTLNLTGEKGQNLSVKVMGNENKEHVFKSSDFLTEKIYLGRGISCGIRLEDSLLSKAHSNLSFVQENWILTDGDEEKQSTNGTWVYISEETQLYPSMIFKSNSCVFQVVSISQKT